MWRDRKGRRWEIVIGEFSGKPFSPDKDKFYTDRCKLFRCMKDVLDDRLLAVAQNRLDKETYKIAKSMLAYVVQSYGETIDIFALNMPFPHVYVVSSICSLEVPCQ